MSDERLSNVAAVSLVIGGVLGLAGTFVPSAELRSLAWGIDGTFLVVASALLTAMYVRRGDVLLAAGFLVFLAGETLIVSGSGMELRASTPSFASGAMLWSAGLLLVSASPVMPRFVRATGVIAAILLTWTALQMFSGADIDPLSKPMPFFAYPFLGFTLFGWAWVHKAPSAVRGSALGGSGR